MFTQIFYIRAWKGYGVLIEANNIVCISKVGECFNFISVRNELYFNLNGNGMVLLSPIMDLLVIW